MLVQCYGPTPSAGVFYWLYLRHSSGWRNSFNPRIPKGLQGPHYGASALEQAPGELDLLTMFMEVHGIYIDKKVGPKMGFFGFLLLGLLAGAIAKLILPGRQGGGWLITLLLGVIGALLGGWIGGVLFHTGLQDFFSLTTWLLAIGGSIIVLLIYGLLTGRRTHRG